MSSNDMDKICAEPSLLQEPSIAVNTENGAAVLRRRAELLDRRRMRTRGHPVPLLPADDNTEQESKVKSNP